MTPERMQQIRSLFEAALEQDAAELESFVERASGNDSELRADVLRMLEAHRQANGYLSRPAAALARDEATAEIRGAERVLAVGDVVANRFEIVELLGAGGMGEVYRARDRKLHRDVALKVLSSRTYGSADHRVRFEREARAASALNHPNIATVYDLFEESGVQFIAMEYVRGGPLGELIPGTGLPLHQAIAYAVQIAEGLSAAHTAGIVHRDLKPGNIIITETGTVKILDFGLAKLVEGVYEDAGHAASASTAGVILGTPAYMSPEQAEGKPVDARTDIFSFGSVLYEVVTGRMAFTGDTNMSVLAAIVRDEPASVNTMAPGLPGEVDKIISRCLRKDASRRFQHMADVRVALEDLKEEIENGTVMGHRKRPVRQRRPVMVWMGAVAVVLAAAIGLTAWLLRLKAPARPNLIRVTSDSGLSDFPALSPDGKLLAYASDRAGENNLDLWVKQVPDGEPVRLTRGRADEYDPSFSPDGTRLVYRSEEDGGGIYLMPALGGEPRLLVRRGRNPRFSPDGAWVSYLVSGSADDFGEIYLVPAMGGAARPLQPRCAIALGPIWAPDGKHILFWGSPDKDARFESFDWWIASAEGGAPIRSGAAEVFKKQNLIVYAPGAWAHADMIVFTAGAAGFWNLWDVRVSRTTWKIAAPAQKLTFGADNETSASVASGGRLAFTSNVANMDIWSAALDPGTGKAVGESKRLTQDAGYDFVPTVSIDGTRIVFLSERGHGQTRPVNVWMKDVGRGRDAQLTFTGDAEYFPVISPDGSLIAYRTASGDPVAGKIHVMPAEGGAAEKVCEDCGRPRAWSPDRRRIISQRGSPLSLLSIDLATRKVTDFLRHPTDELYAPQFSPEGHWLAFGVRLKSGEERIFIVPVGNGVAPQDPAQWIAITNGPGLDNKPRWSADGNLLYFTSDRDEFNCIWAQRLDPRTKRPSGAPFPFLHFHGAVRSYAKIGSPKLDFSVARDKVVFHLDEIRGNIWITELSN
jgi:eukaryotic-like serine/threonine-protein kinase